MAPSVNTFRWMRPLALISTSEPYRRRRWSEVFLVRENAMEFMLPVCWSAGVVSLPFEVEQSNHTGFGAKRDGLPAGRMRRREAQAGPGRSSGGSDPRRARARFIST